MFIGIGSPIPDLGSLPGASRPGNPPAGGGVIPEFIIKVKTDNKVPLITINLLYLQVVVDIITL